MSTADPPSFPSARPAPGERVRRGLGALAVLAVGYGLGAALDTVALGSVRLVLWVLGIGGLVAVLVVAHLDDRRLVEDLSTAGPDAPVPRPPLLRAGRSTGAVVWIFGGLLVWSGVHTSTVGTALLVVTAVPVWSLLGLGVRAGVRRRWDAARAAHPGAGVVLASFSEIGGIAWGRWARSAGVRAPAQAAFASLLVGDADGLEQRLAHDGTLLHRWAWDEVELSRALDPDRPAGSARAGRAVLVLTLLGPEPTPAARAVPVRRQRSDVTLHVMEDAWSVSTPAVVDAAIACLRAGVDGRGADGDHG